MRAWGLLLVPSLVALGPSAHAQGGAKAGVAVAELSFVHSDVERAVGDGWRDADEGSPVRTGERLRTGRDGLAQVDFPWMRFRMSASSELAIPAGLVLSMVLERGRIEILSEGDIIKLISQGAEIRGQGRAVVRHSGGATVVSVIEGQFRVTAQGQRVSLSRGEGTLVRPGERPSPAEPLPEPPESVEPGSDPLYVEPGQAFPISWTPSRDAHRIQVLGINSDTVLIDRDVERSPGTVSIPWQGTFRWRVSTRDERGLEGAPSAEGLICVVE